MFSVSVSPITVFKVDFNFFSSYLASNTSSSSFSNFQTVATFEGSPNPRENPKSFHERIGTSHVFSFHRYVSKCILNILGIFL
jgi:hypothetical protein